MWRELAGLFAVGMDSINRDIHRIWGEGFSKISFNIFSMISRFPDCKDARDSPRMRRDSLADRQPSHFSRKHRWLQAPSSDFWQRLSW